ncbi:MAG: hypothetical protein AB1635_08365 [Acidobacteriota bacterium]
MRAAPRRAFAVARARAHAGRLRRRAEVAGRAVGLSPKDGIEPAIVRAEFLALCGALARGCPELRALVTHLVARRELGNVALALAVLTNRRDRVGLDPLWEPLGDFAHVSVDDLAGWQAPADLAEHLGSRGVEWLAPVVRRGRPGALGETLLAAGRAWASRASVLARGLPAGEDRAVALVEWVLLDADFDWLRRAPARLGVAPEVAARATVVVAARLGATRTGALAAWREGEGPLGERLPGRWAWARAATGWDDLMVAARHERRRACLAALMGPPFALAVPLAIVLLKSAELDAAALGPADGSPARRRATAASLLET